MSDKPVTERDLTSVLVGVGGFALICLGAATAPICVILGMALVIYAVTI